jgi:hypothetical protein
MKIISIIGKEKKGIMGVFKIYEHKLKNKTPLTLYPLGLVTRGVLLFYLPISVTIP